MRDFSMVWLLDGTLKTTLLLLFAALIVWRIRQAGGRHLVWTLTMALALLMPIFSWGVPDLVAPFRGEPRAVPVATLPAPQVPAADPVGASPVSSASSHPHAEVHVPETQSGTLPAVTLERGGDVAPPPAAEAIEPAERAVAGHGWPAAWPAWVASPWLAAIWFGGMLFSVLPLVLGWGSLLRVQRRSMRMGGVWPELLAELQAELGLQRRVVLLQSRERSMPMTWGAVPGLPAYILLPKDCCEWSSDRRRAVLLHELAHIQRWDCLTQTLAQLVCALYWFHPLVWYGAHRMLIERERACDDRVLMQDMRPSDYAEHLLSIAQSRQGLRLAGLAGIAMARQGRRWWGREGGSKDALRGGLSERVMAILDAHRQRAALGHLKVAVLTAVMGAMTLSVAMLEAIPLPPLARVELDPAYGWRSSHWAGSNNTWFVAEDLSGAAARFEVFEPGRRHVWTNRQMAPIDARERYPILVMRYRALGTDPTSNGYVLWVDDGTGPDRGGLRPVRSSDLIADGDVHEIRRDMREVDGGKIAGDLTWLAVGVHCSDEQETAEFELVSLAFEADRLTGPAPQPLTAAEPIRVRVQDREGRPVAGARVMLDPLRLDRRQVGVTDPQGQAVVVPWAFGEAGRPRHQLHVTAPGRMALWRPDVAPGSFETLILEPARSVSGVVVDETDQPVSGAVVRLQVGQSHTQERIWLENPPALRTDAQGHWHWEGLPISTRQMTVEIRHPAFVPQVSGSGEPARVVEVPDQGEIRQVLARGAWIRGRVVDTEGKPITGATVFRGTHARAVRRERSIQTDREGRFELGPLLATPQPLTISAPGYAPILQTVTPGSEAAVEMVLPPGQVVRFQVVDQAGEAVPGASIAVDRWQGQASLAWSARTDAQGKATWNGAPQEPVTYRFHAPGYRTRDRVELQPSEEEHPIQLFQAMKLRGAVTDARTGQPIEVFTVTRGIGLNRPGQPPFTQWEEFRPTQGQSGRYEIQVHDDYPFYQVRIEVPGYLPLVSPPLEPKGQDVVMDLALEPAEVLHGQVRTADGQPVAGATLLVLESGQQAYVQSGELVGMGIRISARTGPDGRFTLDQVDFTKARRVAVVHPQGYAEMHPVQVEALREVVLQPWARIEGEAWLRNQPHADAEIVASRRQRGPQSTAEGLINWNSQTRSDDAGRFVLDYLPAGQIMVHRRLRREGQTVGMDRAGVAQLEAGQRLRDFQVGTRGRPVVGRIGWPAEPVAWDRAQAGLNEIDPEVEALLEQIRALLPEGYATWEAERRQVWAASEAGVALNALNAAYAERHLHLRNIAVRVEPDGTFRAEDVPAGHYQLEIFLMREVADGQMRRSGNVHAEVVVPDMPEGYSDQPLEIGDVKIALTAEASAP